MKNSSEKFDKLFLKIEFYILSLWLLFALVFLLTIDVPIFFKPNAKFIGFWPLLKRNWLAILALIMLLIGIVITLKLRYRFKGVHNPPSKIVDIKNKNYEYLTFLTTYIIPLICINLNEFRYAIILIILLFIIGSVFVKTELYLGNPTLALLGYHLYCIKVEHLTDNNEIVVISKDKLTAESSIKWIEITDSVWVAKEIK